MFFLGIPVALNRVVVKSMYETIIENFLTLANLVLTEGKTLMIAGGMDILDFSAIALMLGFLTARIVKRKHGRSFEPFQAQLTSTNNCASDRFFARKRTPALKPCPNCDEQLPLSALVCDTCDYNFLAARPGRGQKLLPPPELMTHDVPEQSIASTGI